MADMKEKLLKSAEMIVDEVEKEAIKRGREMSMEEWMCMVDMVKDASEIYKNVHKVEHM